jgi:hypothetical protein
MALDHDKLAKVLALAGSGNDGEALAAVRRAGAMLAAEGLSFTDLAAQVREAAGASGSAWQKAADHLGAYLRERAERREEVDRLTARIAELERAGRAKDRTVAELRGELARLAEAVERAMPAAAGRTGPEPRPAPHRAPPRPRRRGPQFELALE